MQGTTFFDLTRVDFYPTLEKKSDALIWKQPEKMSKTVFLPLDYQRQPEDPLSKNALHGQWAAEGEHLVTAEVPSPRCRQWQRCQQMEPKIIAGPGFPFKTL